MNSTYISCDTQFGKKLFGIVVGIVANCMDKIVISELGSHTVRKY